MLFEQTNIKKTPLFYVLLLIATALIAVLIFGRGLFSTFDHSSDFDAYVGYEFQYELPIEHPEDISNLSGTISKDIGLDLEGTTISGTPNSQGPIEIKLTGNTSDNGTFEESFSLTIGIKQKAIRSKFGKKIDLENLYNYANQPIPDYVGPLIVNNNPITDAGATLGRVLFYDKSLSTDGTVSCSSCHQQSLAFSDDGVVSDGIQNKTTGRHSMRLVNLGFIAKKDVATIGGTYPDSISRFWDRRASSLEEQATMPIKDANEHGFSGADGQPSFDDLIIKMKGIDYYEELFRFVYGDAEINEDRIQKSLTQFTRSIHSFDSKYDEGMMLTGDTEAYFPNFTEEENRGKDIFGGISSLNGGANCVFCHSAPEFAMSGFSAGFSRKGHNGTVGKANAPNEYDYTNTRAPALRDLVGPNGRPNGPFMHDGSKKTLRGVIDHYNDIPVPFDPHLKSDFLKTINLALVQNTVRNQSSIKRSTRLPLPLDLSEQNKEELEAFLKTLTGKNIYEDKKWSDPF